MSIVALSAHKKLDRAFQNRARTFASLDKIYCEPTFWARASEPEPELIPPLLRGSTSCLALNSSKVKSTGCHEDVWWWVDNEPA